MNIFAISGLVNAITVFILGAIVYTKNKTKEINVRYAQFCFFVAFWSFCYFLWQIAQEKNIALFWVRGLMAGAIFIPVFFLHFVLLLLDVYENKKRIIDIGYLIFSFFFLSNFTPWFVKDVRPKMVFRFWPDAGPLFGIFLLIWFWYCLYAAYLLIRDYKKFTGMKHQQIKYVLIAILIGYSSGSTNYFLWYNIPVQPYGNFIVPLFVSMMAYAIVKHQLMEIEVIIKKSFVFAGMFAFVFGVVVTVAMLVAQLLGGDNNILSLAISAFIITFTLRPLETWLVNSTDKFLFQKKYEYKQILKAFIDEVITVLNLDEVVNSTLKLLDQTIHPYTQAIFILNKVEDKYQLYNAIGLEDKNIIFTSDSKLISFLKKTKDPAVIKQIDGIVGVSPKIASEMSSLKAVVVLPLILHNDLIGFISLGKKKSDEDYTKDDLDVLADLARTESIAVGNAQLITEAAQTERRAAIGTMAAGIYHEIGNPLNIMSTKIQIFKLARQKGLLQNKSNEEILNEAEIVLNECLKQSGRIADITRKLSNFAKPSKEFKPQLISIPEEIEETLAVVGHDLELEKIKIDNRFSSDLSKILADRQEIQQVFFNLIRNAAQAIEGAGTITISALNTSNDNVHIEIQDTGKGIPEDRIHRIFEPFFTTKGPNKGTGLGLSIVRQLVWRNKGEISFRSQVGAGTTFILEFPRAIETL